MVYLKDKNVLCAYHKEQSHHTSHHYFWRGLYPLLVTRYSLHVTSYLLLVTGYSLNVTRYASLVIHHLLHVIYPSLHFTCYFLLVTRYTLVVRRYVLHDILYMINVEIKVSAINLCLTFYEGKLPSYL